MKNFNLYAKIFFLLSVLILFPLVILPFYPNEFSVKILLSFLIPSICGMFLSYIVSKIPTKEVDGYKTSMQKGSLPVLFTWAVAIILGALPLIIGGETNILRGIFESTSGWTGTGFSIFKDIEALPHIYLFHRAYMQYCGGLGLIFMLILFSQGKQGSLLFDAEGHSEKFTPGIKQTCRTIFALYSVFLGVGILLYVLAGMNFFDSVCHTMSSLSTAGFSTKNEGILYFKSIPIEIISALLMLIGATSFSVLSLLGRFKFKEITKITEVRFAAMIVVIFTVLMSVNLYFSEYDKNAADVFFDVVSTYSTTGFSTVSYDKMPAFSFVLAFLLMLCGGCVGSTSGGIKMLRVYLICKITKVSIRRKLVPPRRVLAVNFSKVGGRKDIDDRLILDTVGFVMAYFFLIILGTLLLILTENCSVQQAFFEFTSTFSNVGISVGLTNYETSAPTLIIQIFGMILGRLEIFTVFLGLGTLINHK